MTLTLGLPQMRKEAGERRAFLPSLAQTALDAGCEVLVERGLGAGLGLTDADYLTLRGKLRLVDHAEAWRSDLVLVLRSPEVEDYPRLLRAGTTLVSMLHLPTRPRRVACLTALDVEAVSLDSLADDTGARLVENTRAVGWNGLEAAFEALERFSPQRLSRGAPPIQVTVVGTGQVGRQAIDAATKYGARERAEAWAADGRPPVLVTAIGRALMALEDEVHKVLRRTDVLVDASQRADASVPLIHNRWLGELPREAVICDLVVDPYVLTGIPKTVRSIEGIPCGNLDQWVFAVNDPVWARTVPASIPQLFRRPVASCYSWPGVHPHECMEHYGRQLAPLLQKLIERGGASGLRRDGDARERALWRASLRPGAWARPHRPKRVDAAAERDFQVA